MLNERIILKDDIEFVTEIPCLLGHPVAATPASYFTTRSALRVYVTFAVHF